ncbi:molecular chaperone DnaJ [Candidatus Falkowbacteria bacterium]|nr:molecular chaperone DnaJ [Candidatus Falkowbacteria bacterium]
MGKDYYKILGIEKGASADEVKRAFRKLAHEHHPDKAGGNEAKFKEINEAYQVLGNEQKRKQYDQFGATFDQQGGFGGGMNWDDFMKYARGGGGQDFGGFNFNFNGMDLSDIFGDLFGFGGSGRRGTKKRGGDNIQIDLTLEFKEAIFGAQKSVELYKTTRCDHCRGNLAEPGTKIATCSTCGGQGRVAKVQQTFFGAFQTAATCPNCHGEGKRPEVACSKCRGQGVMKQKETVEINIPAGVEDGMTLQVSGKGNVGLYGGRAGNLYVNLHVRADSRFERDADDIYVKAKIAFTQAILGDKIDIETLDGVVSLKIPEATQPGTQFRLREKGVPGNNGRGDMYVIVEVVIPTKLSRRQRQLLEGFNE